MPTIKVVPDVGVDSMLILKEFSSFEKICQETIAELEDYYGARRCSGTIQMKRLIFFHLVQGRHVQTVSRVLDHLNRCNKPLHEQVLTRRTSKLSRKPDHVQRSVNIILNCLIFAALVSCFHPANSNLLYRPYIHLHC